MKTLTDGIVTHVIENGRIRSYVNETGREFLNDELRLSEETIVKKLLLAGFELV